MRYVILWHRHFLGKIGRWEYSPKLNPLDGYPTFPEVREKLAAIESRPYRRNRRKLESVRPNYWIVSWGHPKHRSAIRYQCGKELEGDEGLPFWARMLNRE
jgi:hypothetical protein